MAEYKMHFVHCLKCSWSKAMRIEVDFENEDATGASMSWEWFLNLINGDLKSKTAGRFQNSKTNEWEGFFFKGRCNTNMWTCKIRSETVNLFE